MTYTESRTDCCKIRYLARPKQRKAGRGMKRVGLLTSGGDCQALNATMRGIVKALSHNISELEVYGFMNG